MRHPEDGLLLRYLDGELPGRKARQVRTHLEACWQCRAQVEELQGVIGECVRYRKNVLAPGLPPPPEPWRSLDFDRVEVRTGCAIRFCPPGAFPLAASQSGPALGALRSRRAGALLRRCYNSFAKLPR